VSALDGGLPRWVAEGGEVEMGAMAEIGESDYDGSKGLDPEFVRCEWPWRLPRLIVAWAYEQIVENSEKSPENPEFELVLDHRSLAR